MRSLNLSPEEMKTRRKALAKTYRATPEVKARKKANESRPEYKAQRKAQRKTAHLTPEA